MFRRIIRDLFRRHKRCPQKSIAISALPLGEFGFEKFFVVDFGFDSDSKNFWGSNSNSIFFYSIGFGFEKFLGFGFGFKLTNPILKGLGLKLKNVDSYTSEDVTVVVQVCFTNL